MVHGFDKALEGLGREAEGTWGQVISQTTFRSKVM